MTLEHINKGRWQQMQGTGKRIGECLVDLGHTAHDEVHRALQVQELDAAESGVFDKPACGWHSDTYGEIR